MMMDAAGLRRELVRISHIFYQRGWTLATSGNFSARAGTDRLLISASGRDKGLLNETDILELGLDGTIFSTGGSQPSAEAHLHCALYKFESDIGAILHTHSVYGTVLSSLKQLKAPLTLGGYEMVKAFRGVSTHLHTEHIPIFANDQDMKALAAVVLQYLERNSNLHGFLIAGHGLYSWGRNLAEALRHAEAFEFLLECEYRKLLIHG